MPGKPWSPDEIDALTQAVMAGESDAAVAQRLGRPSVAAIRRQRLAIGIFRAPENGSGRPRKVAA